MTEKPWISGPKELPDHAKSHLQSREAFDCRIAMISIDNAVELAIRTYLGLPKRMRDTDGTYGVGPSEAADSLADRRN
jgi:hypothetical protein